MPTTQESFDDLLAWLNPDDRDAAGVQYEIIYAGLVRFFVSHGLSNAEDLADETVDRVIRRLPDIRATWVGPPAKYFHGVARNILREPPPKEIATDADEFPVDLTEPQIPSDEYACLLKCLDLLTPEKRDLILDYYLYRGQEKIEHHKRLAHELGSSKNALRIEACRIRKKLEECARQCVQKLQKKQNTPGKP